jgi:hypothetical protein
MANPLDQFTTYVSQNPDSLTGSVAKRSTVNPVARRLTDVLDAASTTEPVLNDLVTIVDTTVVNEVAVEPTTITVATDSLEALKVSIFDEYIQPFINANTAVNAIDDIADVVVTEPAAGQVLKYNGTNWVNGIDATVTAGTGTGFTISAETATGGANILLTGTDGSTDAVKIAAGSNITIARTDASTITINSTATGTGGSSVLSTLGDVELGVLANGQVLKYNGSKWVNGVDNSAAAGATALTGLTDVLLSGPTNGQVLKYDGSKWVNAVDATATAGGGGVSYSISAETVSNVTTLRLTGSDASTDNVKFAAGSGMSILRTDADTITLANTYAYTLPQATTTALGGVKVDGTTITINATTGVITATTAAGTVTSVGGTGTVSGLTLTGTVTGSGNLTLGGTLSLTSANVTGALGFTPYNATNPSSYITINSVSGTYAPLDSPAFTNNPTAPTQLTANNSTRLATTAFVKAQGYTSNVGDATLAGTQTFTGAKTFTGGLTSQAHNFAATSSIYRDTGTGDIRIDPAGGSKMLIGAAVNASVILANVSNTPAYEFNSADYRCSTDISRTLGTSNFRWGQIYSSSASINTSDERSKTDIVDCPLGLDFILDLEPKFFKLRVASNIEDPTWTPDPDYVPGPGEPLMQRPRAIPVAGVRDHAGLIAQNVRAALDRAGIADWAGWGLDDKDDPNSRQHLRYESFIAPLIKSVHQVCDRLDALEQRLGNLENP